MSSKLPHPPCLSASNISFGLPLGALLSASLSARRLTILNADEGVTL
jgi:hypothetical protein